MAAAFRVIAFLASAIGLEILRGAGLATLGAAAIAGALRLSPWFVPVVMLAGAALSLALPEDVASSGTIAHSLSNTPFVLLLHFILAGLGYSGGRIVRRLLGR